MHYACLGGENEADEPGDHPVQHSLGVATAIAKRRVAMEHFTEAAIKSPDILEVASKISVVLDHSLDRSDRIPPGKVEIITKEWAGLLKPSGRSFRKPREAHVV